MAAGTDLKPSDGSTNSLDRVKRLLLQPKSEWQRIDAEATSVGEIFRGWVLIMAAIPAVAGLIGALAFGYSAFGITYRPGVIEALVTALVQYVLSVASILILALVIDWLAPRFGGIRSRVQATKVAAYSATAAYVAGIFAIVPSLSVLGLLGLYSLYLLHLGLGQLMKAPGNKAMSYTVATIIAAFALAVLAGALTAPLTGVVAGTHRTSEPGSLSGTISVPGGGSLDLTELEEAARELEAAAAEAAQEDASAVEE